MSEGLYRTRGRLNTITWLTTYLDECGRNSGKPLTGKALERFLPWTACPEDLRAWATAL